MPDELTLRGGKAVLTTEEGQRLEKPEAKLLDMLRDEFVPPLSACALPDGVKFVEWRPPLLAVVHQLPPLVRQVRWIAANSPERYGPGTVYRKVRLSVPYAITFALYAHQGHGLFLTGHNELYFRTDPLRSRDDKLCFPALLNISRIVTPLRERAWICTQYLQHDGADWTGQLEALLEHTWNGGFNLSSEDHEGESWYGASKGVHRDLHPIDRWEKASKANDAFALGVAWKEAPLTAGDLIEALFLEYEQAIAAAAGVAKPARGKKKTPSIASRFLNYVQKG
jgi:hypothetical protein